MIISLRQTYGDDRKELYDILSRDEKLIDLYNQCDINIQSFHNCSKETIEYFKSVVKLRNPLYLEFNNIPFTQTVKRVVELVKDSKADHFLWTQDDTFSTQRIVDWNELLGYVNEYEKGLLISLTLLTNIINITLIPDEKLKSFNVWKLDTHYIGEKMYFAMDDSPYICSTDMLDVIYGEEYFEYDCVWTAEQFLFRKFNDVNIPRYVISDYVSVLKNYNLYGRTLGKVKQYREELIKLKYMRGGVIGNTPGS